MWLSAHLRRGVKEVKVVLPLRLHQSWEQHTALLSSFEGSDGLVRQSPELRFEHHCSRWRLAPKQQQQQQQAAPTAISCEGAPRRGGQMIITVYWRTVAFI